MERQQMKRRFQPKPRSIGVLLTAGIVLIAVAVIIVVLVGHTEALTIGTVVTIGSVSLAAVSVYYARVQAKVASQLSVSYSMESPEPGYFRFSFTNHSKIPVRCWCKLNPSYEGHALRFGGRDDEDGFYAGAKSVEVLPLQTVPGRTYALKVFFMGEANELWNQMARRRLNGFPRMHFDIEFSYESTGSGFGRSTVRQRYCYDFGIDKMRLDYIG